MSRQANLKGKPPLGVFIVTRLRDIGRSQKWLAEEAGIDQSYVCQVISGKYKPSLTMLNKIANCVDVSVESLVNAFLSKE